MDNDAIQIIEMTVAVENAIYAGIDPFSKLGLDTFKAHCKEIGASYYAQPKETFSIVEGIRLAVRENNSIVYMEDLS